ncbi:BtpA/SgcQ family protein [Coriobacteriales bacterium OH1046]|nr:BtpA/SgcQ family protein [Coriobacteriales bacterium OH1046]
MLWTEELFGTKKPIISMLHLDPLPGDPRFGRSGGSVSTAVEHAKRDLEALQEGGVDGIIVSNEFSLPYQRRMNFVTPATMAYVVGQLRSELSVPYGVDAISDGLACIELAAACEASFVRGTFSGVYVGDGGLYNNDFSMLMRRKAELHLDDLRMLYFINPESDRNLDTRPLADIAASTIFKVHPDGLCVSANAAGTDVDSDLIASVKAKNPEVAVLVNTGCRPDTIEEKLSVSDAAVVGTYFKEGGQLEDDDLNNVRVDVNRVKEFMDVVYEVRKSL